uniref:Uncharacterized protein n=1 Tax=Polytomella parva TaxID=51329 RepID=A0A7S0VLS2_9CHLO|nr:dnaj-like protein/chaperone protein dnaj 2 (DJA2) [Polytomella parva]|mmetsp:Transcript_8426/g.16174  ORF Transcript_8426/g.16174 Transcript_8426/m.16174 type:complete len:448 (+) Transcript_8426:58-1401(+)
MFNGFPFGMGGMGGMGGMPRGFGEAPQRERKPVNNTKYYELLGVSKDATPDELKKAHRKLALKHHPDKGGDTNKFKEINEAYDVLKDEEKRQIYDEHGEEGIKEGVSGGGDGMDIFDMFMGGGGGRGGGRPREKKSKDVQHTVNVTLEDVYKGASKNLALSRQVTCDACNGSCSKSGDKYECKTCNGSGVTVQIRQMGPMIQQIQGRCSVCRGSGTSIPESDKCNVCSGEGLRSEKKTFSFHVERGARSGQRITLRGEAGSSEPGLAPGDLVLTINIREHETFKRSGADLLMKHNLTLAEALCGTTFTIPHLDGRLLRITSLPGEVIKPGTFKRIEEEGMPIYGLALSKGNLYIEFDVIFPDQLSWDQVQKLKSVMPMTSPSANAMETEADAHVEDVHNFNTVHNIEEELKSRSEMARGVGGDGNGGDDSDDDDGRRGGPQVQCAQQ